MNVHKAARKIRGRLVPRRKRPAETTRSERWMRLAANDAAELVNQKIKSTFHWNDSESIEWCSPLRNDQYAEYYDKEFLECLGVSDLQVPLSDFWPRSGPRWDGLARTDGGKLILVEAKAYPEEAVDGTTDAGLASLRRIEAAIAEAKKAYGVPENADWMTPFYQYANRLAHLHFLAGRNGLDAYLVFLNFAGAPDVPHPCSAAQWEGANRVVDRCLRLPKKHRYTARIARIVVDIQELSSYLRKPDAIGGDH